VYGVGDSKEFAKGDCARMLEALGISTKGAIIFAEVSLDQAKRIVNADGPIAWPLEGA
jgi:hypothetical protein